MEMQELRSLYPTNFIRNNLLNQLSYRTSINVDGLQLYLLIEYNCKVDKRVLTITDINDRVILPSTILSAKRRIFPLFLVNYLGYDFHIVLEPKDNNNISKDYLNWSEHFYLTFVSTPLEFTDVWDEAVRKSQTE